MIFRKINIYLFTQICKYFFLILFIFLSIAWLLQITRLFTITNFIQSDIFDVLILSFYLIPNLIAIIIPFILIFSLLLCFTRLNKDNELISILSLGMALKPFKISLIFFSFFILILFSILNNYLAPKIYEEYKKREYDLRNTLNIENIAFSNFLSLNKNTTLDFKKIKNEYHNILINYKDSKDNLIYAKKGNIINKNNHYKFQLYDGFKISIDEKKQIEKLEFLNYILKVENNNIVLGKNIDKNTFTIFDDINKKNYLNITFKFLDVILILYILFFFYINNLRKINFKIKNNIFFSSICVIVLLMNQILKNSEIILFNYTIIISLIIIFSSIFLFIKNKYE